MSPRGHRSDEPETPTEVPALVCGLCEECLPGSYDCPAEADQAADDHVGSEHAERKPVVIVPVSRDVVEDGELASVIELVAQAQARVDRGETAKPLLEIEEAGLDVQAGAR